MDFEPRTIVVNSKPCLIFSTQDFFSLVENHMGYEARQYIEEFMNEAEAKADYTAEKIDTDLVAYEEELNSYRYCMQDIQDEVDHLGSMERFSRKAVLESIKRIKTEISNCL